MAPGTGSLPPTRNTGIESGPLAMALSSPGHCRHFRRELVGGDPLREGRP